MEKYLNYEPEKKRPKTETSDAEKRKQYEKCQRKRSFQTSWRNDRNWLEFSAESETMTCKICKEAADVDPAVKLKNTFYLGCRSLKLESVKLHETSANHMKAKKIIEANKNPTETSAFKIITNLNKDIIDKLSKLFKTVDALCKHNRPFSDYIWHCKLDESKGLILGQTYRNEKSAKSFANAIAVVEQKETLQVLSERNFISVLSDGTTDVGTCEQEMFFLRYSNRGQVETTFIATISVERGNAEGIFQALKIAITQYLGMEWPVLTSKLCALGCDGASVMLGKKSGLTALLKKEQPALLAIHCYAHRLELSFKDAVKSVNLYEKVITLTMGLFYFYSKSALNRNMLKRAYKTLDKSPLMPKRVGGTRWIGHMYAALTNLLKGYRAFILHLEQVNFFYHQGEILKKKQNQSIIVVKFI